MDVAPYLWFGNVGPAQHIPYDYVICKILLITLVIRRLSTAMLFINYND
jgi:hypothetical protein